MTRSACRRTRATAAAVVLLTLGLTACSGDEGGGSDTTLAADSDTTSSSSAASPTTSAPPVTTTTSATTAPATASAPPTTAPSTTASSTTASSPTAPVATTMATTPSTSTTPPFDTTLANACVNATGKMNAVVRQWNAATRTQRTSQLNAAADAMGTTAGQLRTIGRGSGDTTFAKRADDVASELEQMKRDRDDDKSVLTTRYNNAARDLRSYCKSEIGA